MKLLVGQWEDMVRGQHVLAWETDQGAHRFYAECYHILEHVDTLYSDTKWGIKVKANKWFMSTEVICDYVPHDVKPVFVRVDDGGGIFCARCGASDHRPANPRQD